MTDQHPLTDDIIRYDKKLGCQDIGTWIYTENDLRAAADWQLEEVIDWIWKQLEEDKDDNEEDVDFCYYITDNIVDELRAAMRPNTTHRGQQ